jgi:hypothetical protein
MVCGCILGCCPYLRGLSTKKWRATKPRSVPEVPVCSDMGISMKKRAKC